MCLSNDREILMPWWGWTVVAACIGLAELHMPGSCPIWIALGGALAAALTRVFALFMTAQVSSFIIASALCCAAGFFVYRRVGRQPPGVTTLNQR